MGSIVIQTDLQDQIGNLPLMEVVTSWAGGGGTSIRWQVSARKLAMIGGDRTQEVVLSRWEQEALPLPEVLDRKWILDKFQTQWDMRKARWLKDFLLRQKGDRWQIIRDGRQWGASVQEFDFLRQCSTAEFNHLESATEEMAVGWQKIQTPSYGRGQFDLLHGTARLTAICERKPVWALHLCRAPGLRPQLLSLYGEDGAFLGGNLDFQRATLQDYFINSFVEDGSRAMWPSWFNQQAIDSIVGVPS